MLKVVVFDFDGTLADSVEGIWQQYQKVVSEMNLPKRSFEEFCTHLGKTWEEVLYGLWPEIDIEKFNSFYESSAEDSKPVEGLPEALHKLADIYRLAILTSRGGKSLARHMESACIDESLFEMVFHRDNTQTHKPDPAVFDEVASQLGVSKDELIYVGDSLVDAECAVNAGVSFVGVLAGAATGKDFEDKNLDYVGSAANVPEFLGV